MSINRHGEPGGQGSLDENWGLNEQAVEKELEELSRP
jgi:hypothetical protein